MANTEITAREEGTARATEEREPAGSPWIAIGSALCFATSAALAVLPRLLPDQAWIANVATRQGASWPLFFVCAVVLAAIASATRARSRERTSPAGAPTAPPVPDAQPAAELARVNGALHDLRVEFVYLKDSIARLQQDSLSAVDPAPNPAVEAAIFRLAASIDQIGAQLGHGLAAQGARIEQALASWSSGMPEGRPAPEERMQDPYATGFDGPDHEIEIAGGYQPGDDDLEVEVALEQKRWDSGLGLLDLLDDETRVAPRTSPSFRPTAAAAQGSSSHSTLAATVATEHAAAQADAKVAHLCALLADPDIQRALGAVQRTPSG